MRGRLAAAEEVWRRRGARDTGDRAYLAYVVVLLAAILGAPVVRAAWLALTEPDAAAALLRPSAAPTAAALTLALWAVALLTGRIRGPAVAQPFVVHVLAGSDLPRHRVFRRQVVTAVVVAVVAAAALSAFVGAAGLVGAGTPAGAVVLECAASGAAVGAVTATCWLLGESFPARAGAAAAVLALGGAAFLLAPGAAAAGSWAWPPVADAVQVPVAGPTAVVVLAAVALALLVATPWSVDRITTGTLTTQAAAWDLAVVHAATLDVGSAAEVYRVRPALGRRLPAVLRRGRPWLVLVVADLVGAVRTPGRAVVGLLAVALAGALTVLTTTVPTVAGLLGAAVTVLLVVGLGAFSRGLRHATEVARDLPLYGMSDAVLVALHTVLPAAVAVVVGSGTAVTAGVLAAPTAFPALLLPAFVVPLVVVLAQLGGALRGPLPQFLLTPVPSPAGDPMALVRVLWAFDAPLLAVLAGATAAAGATGTCVALVLVLALVTAARWSRRR